MDHPLHDLIEAQLAKAKKEGAFDDLPGHGKPLTHIKDRADAVHVRLKSQADVVSPLTVLREQIAAADAQVAATIDPVAKTAQMKIAADLKTRLAIEIETARRNA
ncbi:MAG: DnaJ family domain-containing protein [Pseudomonadota bacterium]